MQKNYNRALPQSVVNWLFEVIQPIYSDRKTVFNDCVQLLSYYRKLRPRTRVFTDLDGTPELLLCIYGQLQLQRGLPLLIWIPKNYPLKCPILYVDLQAVPGSRLRPGKFIDSNGKIHLPIFESWPPSKDGLLAIIQEVTQVFYHSHPLEISRPTANNTRTPGATVIPNTTSTPQLHNLSPPLPPKPPVRTEVATLTDNVSQLSLESQKIVANKEPGVPPRIPRRPKSTESTESPIDLMDSAISSTEETPHKTTLLHLQNTLDFLRDKDLQYIESNLRQSAQSITDAVEKFEKLYVYEKNSLEERKKEMQQNENLLLEKLQEITNELDRVKEFERNNDHIDAYSIAQTNVAAIDQLYALVATDYALSDSINMLSQLLSRGSIELDTFVKKVRGLARKQFLTRMHIDKITRLIEVTGQL